MQKKPSALKKVNSKHECLNIFLLLFVIFTLLDPDSDYGSRSTELIEYGSGYGSGSETLGGGGWLEGGVINPRGDKTK